MGQFGLPYDKRHMYETDIRYVQMCQLLQVRVNLQHKHSRIPLMIRGPGITGGTKSDTAALSIDLAPTILDMAGIPRPDHMDGKSLLPFITVRHLRPLPVWIKALSSFSTIRRQTKSHWTERTSLWSITGRGAGEAMIRSARTWSTWTTCPVVIIQDRLDSTASARIPGTTHTHA